MTEASGDAPPWLARWARKPYAYLTTSSTQREPTETEIKVEVRDPKLVAYDKATGKLVGEVPLPRNATGAPMTYMLGGKQFIVVPTGGANLPAELIVLSLP